MAGNSVVFSFLTQSNFSYVVKGIASLSSSNWTTLSTVPGTGGIVTVTNQSLSPGATYYRVVTQ